MRKGIPFCRKGDILKNVHKRFIMYQLFRATNYLHSGNVIHRDQKPSNVLLDCECNCKIAGNTGLSDERGLGKKPKNNILKPLRHGLPIILHRRRSSLDENVKTCVRGNL